MRPIIGLTMGSGGKPGRYALHGDYIASIEKAGGVPFGIPYGLAHELIPRIVEAVQAVLFTGGDDLDPGLYGQDWHPGAVRIDAARQAFELALLREVERRRKPVLGICLGCQLMNVYRGGSLHQFLPEVPRPGALEHRSLDRELPTHPVTLEPDSQLGQAVGRKHMIVNTYHKQAVDRPGRGLRVVGRAPDGVIEALEDPSFPLFAGVQWHPERLHNELEHLSLFQLLVRRAQSP